MKEYFKWFVPSLAIVLVIIYTTGLAVAGEWKAAQNNVMGVTEDHYKTVISQKPYTVEVCKEVQVSGDRTGDTLGGAIVGGVIGHQIDHDAGAKVGAILGGLIGHNNSDAVGGSRTQCHTETRYEEESREVYSHSTVTFWDNGKEYKVRYTR